jgi:Mg-chelatase subunit ChlD
MDAYARAATDRLTHGCLWVRGHRQAHDHHHHHIIIIITDGCLWVWGHRRAQAAAMKAAVEEEARQQGGAAIDSETRVMQVGDSRSDSAGQRPDK